MPFVVPETLIVQRIIHISAPTAGTPAGIPPDAKAALCMRWLLFKMTTSKQKPEQRMAKVFENFEETAAGARAAVDYFEFNDLASLGRSHGVHIDRVGSEQAGRMSMLLQGLQHKHDAAIAILISNQHFIYPVAAYRSGGKGGLNPHIYLFLPGIGELKGIRPKDFERLVDRGLGLADGDYIIRGKVFAVRPFTATEREEGSDSPTLEESDYAVLGSRGYVGGARPGQVVEDGGTAYARLGQFSATNYEIAPLRERVPSDASEASVLI